MYSVSVYRYVYIGGPHGYNMANLQVLTNQELCDEIDWLLQWSLDVGYYPGKLDDWRMQRLMACNSELQSRLDAQ